MRVRLFSKEYPEGKLFTSEDEYNQAKAEGVWYDKFWGPSGVVPEDLKESWGDRPIEPLRLPEKPKKEIPIYKEDISNNTSSPGEEVKYCECGCGKPTTKRFAPGHYARWMREKKRGDRKNDKPSD